MKNIISFINESLSEQSQKITVDDFLKTQTDDNWNKIKCEDMYDNGGFNSFNDVDEMYKFLNANKHAKINVVEKNTDDGLEVSFDIKGKHICINYIDSDE